MSFPPLRPMEGPVNSMPPSPLLLNLDVSRSKPSGMGSISSWTEYIRPAGWRNSSVARSLSRTHPPATRSVVAMPSCSTTWVRSLKSSRSSSLSRIGGPRTGEPDPIGPGEDEDEDEDGRSYSSLSSASSAAAAAVSASESGSAKPQPPRPYMCNLAVDKRYKRRGVASALVGACEGRAQSADKGRMFLKVREGNEAATKMYERMGYEVSSMSQEGEGLVLLMRKTLEVTEEGQSEENETEQKLREMR
mmetsp:Transcript_30547/g.62302  ORF Transcript_30547/g.62302 Transcript_30547/m.62302 type:complete len:248 (-) Transcript_30547:657-1400(-)